MICCLRIDGQAVEFLGPFFIASDKLAVRYPNIGLVISFHVGEIHNALLETRRIFSRLLPLEGLGRNDLFLVSSLSWIRLPLGRSVVFGKVVSNLDAQESQELEEKLGYFKAAVRTLWRSDLPAVGCSDMRWALL